MARSFDLRAFSLVALLQRFFAAPTRRPLQATKSRAPRARLEVLYLEDRLVPSTVTANADTSWTYKGESVHVAVLANDTDSGGHTLSISSTGQGQHGSVSINSDGTVTYTPTAGFLGSDTFSYTASDGQGGSASANVTVSVYNRVADTWPNQFAAPYVDTPNWDLSTNTTYQFATNGVPAGIKYYTLAFVQACTAAGGNNAPAWGNFTAYEVGGTGSFQTQLTNQIASVRAAGGDVMVSFGGFAGTELAETTTNLSQLETDYQSVINAYQLTHLDFDIETTGSLAPAVVDLRNQAISALQQQAAAAGKELDVWYTLQVEPSGLGSPGLYVLQSAQKYGVKVTGVNIMTMDFDDTTAPNPQGQMGTYAIDAAQSLESQLKTVYGSTLTDAQAWHLIGLTPMIGQNDTTDEVFSLADAQQVETFAASHGVRRLSLWAMDRDHHTDGVNDVPNDTQAYTDSGVHESPLQFSLIFNAFTSTHLVAGSDSATMNENNSILINVLANDQAGTGAPGPLTINSFTQGAHGTVSQIGNELKFTAASGYTGSDSFTYTLGDGSGNTATGTVNVTINAGPTGPHGPIAINDHGTTNAGQAVTINVLNNDGDHDGYALSVQSFTQAGHGSVTQSGSNLVYTPATGFSGTDSFGYMISDGHGGTAVATVTVTVSPPPPPPAGGVSVLPPELAGLPTLDGVLAQVLRVHGRYQIVLTDALTGQVLQRVNLPQFVVHTPTVQRTDVNGDGIPDIVVTYLQGLRKRHLNFSGVDGSSL